MSLTSLIQTFRNKSKLSGAIFVETIAATPSGRIWIKADNWQAISEFLDTVSHGDWPKEPFRGLSQSDSDNFHNVEVRDDT